MTETTMFEVAVEERSLAIIDVRTTPKKRGI
jgi:hypothetical protein